MKVNDEEIIKLALPCPLCGGNPEISDDENIHIFGIEFWITCESCGCRTLSYAWDKIEYALKVWNKRRGEEKAREEATDDAINEFKFFLKERGSCLGILVEKRMREILKSGERNNKMDDSEVVRNSPRKLSNCDDGGSSLVPAKRQYYRTKEGATQQLKCRHERIYYMPGKGYHIVFRLGKTFWERYF